jgi:hypothetical protein
MRLTRLLAALGAYTVLQLPSLCASTPFFQEPAPFNFQMWGGFREDYLKYHIGGEKREHHLEHHDHHDCPLEHQGCQHEHHHGHHDAKDFSKVRWKNLKIAEIGASVNYSTCHHYYMRAKGDYGRIFEGKGTVSNKFTIYRAPPPPPAIRHHKHHKQHHRHHVHHKSADHMPNQGLPSFPLVDNGPHHRDHHHGRHKRLRNEPLNNPFHHHYLHEDSKLAGEANDGNVCDLSGGLGWKVVSGGGRGWVAGIIGYSYAHQNLVMKHLKREKDSHNVIRPEAIEGLKGTCKTSWVGPWVGIDFSAQVECNVSVFGTAEWHYADYRASGNWRLPGYCANTHQHAKACGFDGSLGFDWAPCDQWGIGLRFNYQQWSTRRGTNKADVRHIKPGMHDLASTLPVAKKSHLYRSTWVTYGVGLEASYRY